MPPAVEAWSPNHWTTRDFHSCVVILLAVSPSSILDEVVLPGRTPPEELLAEVMGMGKLTSGV